MFKRFDCRGFRQIQIAELSGTTKGDQESPTSLANPTFQISPP